MMNHECRMACSLSVVWHALEEIPTPLVLKCSQVHQPGQRGKGGQEDPPSIFREATWQIGFRFKKGLLNCLQSGWWTNWKLHIPNQTLIHCWVDTIESRKVCHKVATLDGSMESWLEERPILFIIQTDSEFRSSITYLDPTCPHLPRTEYQGSLFGEDVRAAAHLPMLRHSERTFSKHGFTGSGGLCVLSFDGLCFSA